MQPTTVYFSPHIHTDTDISILRLDNILWPLALLRYAIGGVEQPLGLRIDLGGMDGTGNVLLLDHLENQQHEAGLQKAVPCLSKIIKWVNI